MVKVCNAVQGVRNNGRMLNDSISNLLKRIMEMKCYCYAFTVWFIVSLTVVIDGQYIMYFFILNIYSSIGVGFFL